jgi:EmrB/QacA subfamily drug resistance transporter
MESLDTSILNTAVPNMATELHVDLLHIKLALTSYTLSTAVFIPVSGLAAERFGTRRTFTAAVLIFSLSSLLAGLAPNLSILVLARILQGSGGAMMMPVGTMALVRTFPRDRLVKVMSLIAIPGLVGPLLGPAVGGAIVHFSHWRAIFFINVPIGVLEVCLILYTMSNFQRKRPAPFDCVGFLLFSLGIALSSYGLEQVSGHNVRMRFAALSLVAAAVFLTLYRRHALGSPAPLLQLHLFRVRTFALAVVGNLLMRLGVGGMPFLLPILYQVVLGYAPWEAGLLIAPQALAAMGMKRLIEPILNRFGYRKVLTINTGIIGAQVALFATAVPGMSTLSLIAQAACFGLTTSLQYGSINTLVFADLNASETTMGTSISSTMHHLALSLGVGTAALVVGLFLQGATAAEAATIGAALRYALLILSALTMVSLILFCQLRPHDGRRLSGR